MREVSVRREYVNYEEPFALGDKEKVIQIDDPGGQDCYVYILYDPR